MYKILALFVLIIFCATPTLTLAQAQLHTQQAEDVVQKGVESLLARIQQDRDSFKTYPDQLYKAVDELLGPMVDFRKIARRVMAKHYKTATKEQRKNFQKIFKQSLLTTYAKGLIEFENYRVIVLPSKTPDRNTAKNTKVDLEIITASGQKFPISQSMYFNKKHQRWQMQNVIVNGINIGKLFRDQFSHLVDQQHGDIGKAIAIWTQEIQKKKKHPHPAA